MQLRKLLMAAVAVVVLAVGLAFALRPAAAARVPQGFIGTMLDGPAIADRASLTRELDRMVSSGVESVRVAVDWSAAQPYATISQVPSARRGEFQNVAGVPTRFTDLDRLVGLAAARGLTVLPVVQYAPGWAALQPGKLASPPRSPQPFASFVAALVLRYGPAGAFWAANPQIPRVPIRMWQIWNEPDFKIYWSQQPFAPSYVALLRATHAAIKSADPGAKLVLAGLPDFSWEYLARIYQVPGARGSFDAVAIHPYTAQAAGVIVILRRVRAVMDRAGDGQKPILATEISWPSSEGRAPAQFGIETTEVQQARRLGRVIPLLARARVQLRLIGFYWYTWIGDESPRPSAASFDFAGLLKQVGGQISAKPALAAFTREALSIEACRSKGRLATGCA